MNCLASPELDDIRNSVQYGRVIFNGAYPLHYNVIRIPVMSKTPFRKRKTKPVEQFGSKFEAGAHELVAGFKKSSLIKHRGNKGADRESAFRNWLKDQLPTRYGVTQGEVVDSFEKTSPQMDVLIFDQSRNVPILRGPTHVLPAEALLVSIEVKSTLTKAELRKSLDAAHQLKSLRPFKKKPILGNVGNDPAGEDSRYFHSLFAYTTDLSETRGLDKEFARFEEVAGELGVPLATIDRIYIANRGLLLSDARMGVDGESGPLMYFYMHMLNFIDRENARRHPVPYLNYAGRMSAGWKKFPEI